MKTAWLAPLASPLLLFASAALADPPEVGPAPKGSATTVAARVIKASYPGCKKVTRAARAKDGSIRANCDGKDYVVFTLLDPKDGKRQPIALSCAASKKPPTVSC